MTLGSLGDSSGNVKLEVRNLINVDVTYGQGDLVGSDFSVENFGSWRSVWRPNLDDNKPPEQTPDFETLTIYLNDLKSLTISPPTEHSPTPIAAQAPSFHFIEIHIINTTTTTTKTTYFQSNLFQITHKINDLCQIPFDLDQTASIQIYLFKLGAISSTDNNKSLAIQLAASNLIKVNRRHLSIISDLNLFPSIGQSEVIYNLKVKCSYHSEYYPNSTRTAVELFNFD